LFRKKKRIIKKAAAVLFGLFVAAAIPVKAAMKFLSRRRKRREKIKKAVKRILFFIFAIPAAAFASQLVIKLIKKIRGGYLFDIFDSGRFSFADRSDSAETGEDLDGEQEATDRPGFTRPEAVPVTRVPKDEDADEFNLG